jgi:outer membrane protein assembly factor BamB
MSQSSSENSPGSSANLTGMDLVHLAFKSRVIALDRETGDIVWDWKAPKGNSSYVALLLDGDRLIVSVSGYTYSLDALTGQQMWFNPLKGYGFGMPSLASLRGNSGSAGAAALLAQQQQQAAAAGT